MTIGRTVRTAALVAVLSLSISALGAELFYLHWLRGVVASGNGKLLKTPPETLDRDLRSVLMPGTPRPTVETTLRDRHLAFKVDPNGRGIRAEARDLKGSSPLAETALYLWFFFDQDAHLLKIQSRVTHSHSKAPFSVQ